MSSRRLTTLRRTAAQHFTAARGALTTMVVLALMATLWGGSHAGTALIVTRDVGVPDAIVMLASHEEERLPAAAALARQYPAAIVLLTYPREVTKFNCVRCPERVAWLGTEGVPRERVVVLPNLVKHTLGEAIAVREYASAHPLRRLVVVTSPYHTRRALATFQSELAGSGVIVGVSPSSAWSPARPTGWLWHRYDRGYVTYEWTAILYYRVKFGVPLT